MNTLYERIMKLDYSSADEWQKKIVSEMDKAEIVYIQNVAEYFFEHDDQDEWNIETDFPNIAPPFPVFWMEYSIPQTFKDGDGKVLANPHYGEKIGILFSSQEAENIDDMKWVTSAVLFAGNKSGLFQLMQWLIGIDDKGKVSFRPELNGNSAFAVNVTKSQYENNPFLRESLKENGRGTSFILLAPCLLAISFMHCKNVSIIQQGRNPDVKKRIRHGAKITYHVLEINPIKAIMKHEGQIETTGIKKALHICRGHFKDFSQKGLFGKYHGVFWWNSQVRGNMNNGIVSKDYNVIGDN